MKLVIDINLSPDWVELFREHGYGGVHWSAAGNPRASDSVIMAWAREHGYVVSLHPRSRLLAHSCADACLRTERLPPNRGRLPSAIGALVVRALRQHGEALRAGAIVVLNARSARARILPI